MSYFLWGPGQETEVVLAFGMPRRALEPLYAEIAEAAKIGHPLAVPSERGLPVYVCRSARQSLREAWPSLRRYWFNAGTLPVSQTSASRRPPRHRGNRSRSGFNIAAHGDSPEAWYDASERRGSLRVRGGERW
jgi:hypothetical protein